MPFGVFFCGGLQALEGLLVQGRDFSRPNQSAPSRPPDRAQGRGLTSSSKTEAYAGPLRRLRSGHRGLESTKRGRRPRPEGRTAACLGLW